MISKSIFFTLLIVLTFAQNINAMHCKNTLLRQLINQNSKINISQQKNNLLRLYTQCSSKVEPIDVIPLVNFVFKFACGITFVGLVSSVIYYSSDYYLDKESVQEFEAIKAIEEAKSAAFKAKMTNDPHWQQLETLWAEQDASIPNDSNCCCKCASCKCAKRSSGAGAVDFG